MEHPDRRLGRLVAITLQVLGPDHIAFVVDEHTAGGKWKTNNRRPMSEFRTEARFRMWHV
jgi:hypothetical protein